jgi:xanthine/uracil/vitamin C permease (AzgA family)
LWRKRGDYVLWLLANLGGLVVSSLAWITIWGVHREFAPYVSPEVLLIMGTISLAVAGVSYLSLQGVQTVRLSRLVSLSWPFLVMAVYGLLITMGTKTPTIKGVELWGIAVVVSVSCWVWASITWLHEQGIRIESEQEPQGPAGPPRELIDAAAALPKIPEQG